MQQEISSKKWSNYLIKPSKIIVLFLFQITSLATTVNGARIILGNLGDFYIFFGFGIQLFLLWLFTAGKNALKSRGTLWILVIVFTLLSTYTSFFSLYEGISGKSLNQRSYAIQASLSIDDAIASDEKYNSERQKYKLLQKTVENTLDEMNRYCKGICENSSTPEKRRILKKMETPNEELAKLTRIEEFEKFQKLRASDFIQTKKTFTAKEIEVENKKIINLFLADLSNDNRKTLEAQRSQSSKQNFFLLPFEKLVEHDINAIFALIIASVIDGTSILVGVNPDKINPKQFKSTSDFIRLNSEKIADEVKIFVPDLLKNIGHTLFGILRACTEPLNGILLGLFAGFQRLKHIIFRSNQAILIAGSRQDFLNYLSESIESSYPSLSGSAEYSIDYKQLMLFSQDNKEFKHAYDILIRRFELLKWVSKFTPEDNIIQRREMIYRINDYKRFERWYLSQQMKRFSKKMHDLSRGYEFKTIIYLPHFSRNQR
jgi:hypothetical protein